MSFHRWDQTSHKLANALSFQLIDPYLTREHNLILIGSGNMANLIHYASHLYDINQQLGRRLQTLIIRR